MGTGAVLETVLADSFLPRGGNASSQKLLLCRRADNCCHAARQLHSSHALRSPSLPPHPGATRVNDPRRTILERAYRRYLESENTAAFVKAVSERYLVSTLERLAGGGEPVLRRAATMA